MTSSTLTDRQGSYTREYARPQTSSRPSSQPGIVDLSGASRPAQRYTVPRLVGSTEAPSGVRRGALESPERAGRLVAPRPGAEPQLGERDLLDRYRAPSAVGDRGTLPSRADGARTLERPSQLERPRTEPRGAPDAARRVGPADTRRRSLEDARRAALQRLDPSAARRSALPAEPLATTPRRGAARPASDPPSALSARDIAQLRERHDRALASDPELRTRAQAVGLGAAVAVDVGVRAGLGALTGSGLAPPLGTYGDGYHHGYTHGWHDGWHAGHKKGHFWFWHSWYPTWCGSFAWGWYGWSFGFGHWGYWPSYYHSWWWHPGYYHPPYVTYVPWSYRYTAPAVTYHYTTIVQEQSYVDHGAIEEVEVAHQPSHQPAAHVAPAQAPTSGALHRAALEYLALGDRAFVEGRYGDAVRFYAKAIEFEPHDGVLYLVLSDALFATGDYHYAAFALRRGLELEPDLAQAVDKRRYYGNPADFDRHLALLEAYIEDHFGDDDARLVLAANYLFGDRPDRALVLLESPYSATVAETPTAALLMQAARRALAEEPR